MLRTAQPRQIILLRHAETVKNRQGKHGGGDETLTERGIAQLETTAAKLSGLSNLGRYALFCQPDIRCLHSATLLGTRLRSDPRIIEELRGINMGVVSGLSDGQLAMRHPLVALSYLQWRLGWSLHRPHIRGAESIKDFAGRSLRGLQVLLSANDTDTSIFVGSTSGLLMIHHLLMHDGQLDRRDYHFYELDFGELAIWQLSPHGPPELMQTT